MDLEMATNPPPEETPAHSAPGPWISIVLPVFNETAVIEPLTTALTQACETLNTTYEILFVDDGSTDGTSNVLADVARRNPHVTVARLSRNFGQPAALTAGVNLARGQRLIVMDADLQDDPGLIPKLVEAHLKGAEIVYVVRTSRQESKVRVLLMRAFHRLQARTATYPIPAHAGSFGLIGPRATEEIRRLGERLQYFPGLRAFVGFTQVPVEVPRGKRYDDRSRVGFRGLLRLAGNALFSQSRAPITLFYLIGGITFFVAAGLVVYAIVAKILGAAVASWASTITTTAFFGSVIILGQAFICEYLARIYEEVRGRPSYIVDTYRPAAALLPRGQSRSDPI